jgi:pseudaminic acid synthase
MINIGSRTLGPGHPTFIIAEISANHKQDLSLARETVHAAAAAGVDAIKLQTYTPDTITFNSDAPPFQISHGSVWDGRTLYSIYKEGYTPWEWHSELFDLAQSLGLEAFSSPFDHTAVEFLENLGVPAFKIASFEIVDIPLVKDAASRGKPIILSTGIAREADVRLAVEACREVGNDQIIVLKCTSSYPAPASELNLHTIPDISQRFACLSGISDHTMTNTASIAAVALGASVIERHIIVDRALGGLDSTFSTDASEFAELVRDIRETEASLGSVTYELTESADASRVHSRSLFVVEDVRAGDELTSLNVRSIRPAHGLPPVHLPAVLGRVFSSNVEAGTPLNIEMLR